MPTLLTNRPLVVVDADFQGAAPATPNADTRRSLNSLGMAVTAFTTQRGRQYELARCEAGTASFTVDDPGELLNPDNTSSPFNSGPNSVRPYRPIRMSAFWPLTGNLNTNTAWSGTDASFESTTGGWVAANVATTFVLSTVQAWTGTHSMLVTQGGAGSAYGMSLQMPGAPNTNFVASAYVYIPASPAGTTVTLSIVGTTATASSSAVSTTGAWVRLSVAYVCDDAVQYIRLVGTGNSTPTYYVDGVQLELGTTPSAFSLTGPTRYHVHTGFVERWPSSWTDQGRRGHRALTSVDGAALLAKTIITGPAQYDAMALASGPNVYVPFSDTSFPVKVQTPMGGAPWNGWATPGTQGTINSGGTTFLNGDPALVVAQANASPPVTTDPQYITAMGARDGNQQWSQNGGTMEFWVRWDSGTVYFGWSSAYVGGSATGPNVGSERMYTTAGQLAIRMVNAAGTATLYTGVAPPLFPDGKWHHYVLSFDGTTNCQFYIDSNLYNLTTSNWDASIPLNNLFVQATTYFGGPTSQLAVAKWATYPRHFTWDEVIAHYQQGIGHAGEYTSVRVGRYLSAFWGGNWSYDGMSHVGSDYDNEGRSVIDALNTLSDAEDCAAFFDGSGSYRFQGRDYRSRAVTPRFAFGENVAGGDLPYTGVGFDYDPTYLYSTVSVTSQGVVSTATNNSIYRQTLSQTLPYSDVWQGTQAAIAKATRYGVARQRVSSITLDPTAYPVLWPVCLGIEVSDLVSVARSTAAGVFTHQYYVEQVKHTWSGAAWVTTLQLSPAVQVGAWILGDATQGVLGSTTKVVF